MINHTRAVAVGGLVLLAGCAQVEGAVPASGYRVQVINEWSPVLWQGYENQLVTMINAERAKRSLSPLTHDPALRAIARAHSREMVARQTLSHASADGKTPADRLKAAAIPFRVQAENIRRVGLLSNLMINVMSEDRVGWMNMPGPRANILHPQIQRMGVGVWEHEKGDTYATVVFVGR